MVSLTQLLQIFLAQGNFLWLKGYKAEGKLWKDKEGNNGRIGSSIIRVTDDAKMIVVGEYK
ncbi:hypothetical protein MKX03_000099 [Papaver bracteatum]|nr:hypothetical protein MKX03_000099 [Papaver bracteatum]